MSLSGPIAAHVRPADSGFSVESGFCSICGSPLYKSSEQYRDFRFILMGSLDQDDLEIDGVQTSHAECRTGWDRRF